MSFLRYFDKISWHSTVRINDFSAFLKMGKCNFVFIDFWMHMLLWKAVASGDLQWDALLKANFKVVPMSIPITALSFVYQNVVPVICTDLEGNLSKVRTAIVLGRAIPLVLFLVWNAVILGSISNYAWAQVISWTHCSNCNLPTELLDLLFKCPHFLQLLHRILDLFWVWLTFLQTC